MKVSCPVPLQEPWSPAGYRVVEVADEKSPDPQPGPPPRRAEAGPKTPRRPSSPLGYQIVQTADDAAPAPPRTPAPRRLSAKWPKESAPGPVQAWGLIAGIGVFLLFFLVIVLAARQHRDPYDDNGPGQVQIPVLVQDAPPDAVPAANVPKNKQAKLAPPQDADDCQVCKGDHPPGDRETFGTAVAFARNPQEAGRLARQEDKLLFVLHVSGNFEDEGFT